MARGVLCFRLAVVLGGWTAVFYALSALLDSYYDDQRQQLQPQQPALEGRQQQHRQQHYDHDQLPVIK